MATTFPPIHTSTNTHAQVISDRMRIPGPPPGNVQRTSVVHDPMVPPLSRQHANAIPLQQQQQQHQQQQQPAAPAVDIPSPPHHQRHSSVGEKRPPKRRDSDELPAIPDLPTTDESHSHKRVRVADQHDDDHHMADSSQPPTVQRSLEVPDQLDNMPTSFLSPSVTSTNTSNNNHTISNTVVSPILETLRSHMAVIQQNTLKHMDQTINLGIDTMSAKTVNLIRISNEVLATNFYTHLNNYTHQLSEHSYETVLNLLAKRVFPIISSDLLELGVIIKSQGEATAKELSQLQKAIRDNTTSSSAPDPAVLDELAKANATISDLRATVSKLKKQLTEYINRDE